MIFRKQKEEQHKKKEENDISNLNAITNNFLDSRLDGLRFRIMNKSEFETQKETEPHSVNQISFVRVYDNGEFSHFELYKGDILILPNATPPIPTNKFGKVVRINDDVDTHTRYISATRQTLTLPTGETITGTAVGFSSDSGEGTFLYTDSTGKILLGGTGVTGSSSAKLSVTIGHGNAKSTLTYEIFPFLIGAGPRGGTQLNMMAIRINGTDYYIGSRWWPANIMDFSTTGSMEGRLKNTEQDGPFSGEGRCVLSIVMPNIHNRNLPAGESQFDVKLGYSYKRTGMNPVTSILGESDAPYHRLGFTKSISDGSDLGTPTYVECFVPGFTNYEDFLDIAKIICVPTTDTQGNEVDI